MDLSLFGTFFVLCLGCIIVGTIASFQSETCSIFELSLFISLLILFTFDTCIGLLIFWGENAIMTRFQVNSLESFHAILSSILVGFWLFCRCFAGECAQENFYVNWSCNPQFELDIIPIDTMIVLMLTPFVFCALYSKTITYKLLFITWFIVTSWLIICIVVFQAYNSIFCLVFYVPLSFIILFQTKLRCTEFQTSALNKDIEILRVAEGVKAATKEMQNMVSNVTHDLKSPLTVVTGSVTLIKETIKSSKSKFITGQATVELLMNDIKKIEESVKRMNAMNFFMFESINRMLDTSKAQTGAKLVPRHETLHLAEALELPITCMTSSQDHIDIELLPISSDISSHIITDKQWLQENMICLLSNAVKYSSEGKVTISILLVKLSDLPYSSSTRGASAKASEQKRLETNPKSDIDIRCPEISDESSQLNSETSTTPKNSARLGFFRPHLGMTSNKVGVLVLNEDSSSTPLAAKACSSSLSGAPSDKNVNNKTSNVSKKMPVSSKSSGMFLLIEVYDTGIGVSQEMMDNLFCPFKQAQNFAGGTGLGLYSLSKRVDSLEGHYGVYARTDGIQGSVFWFAIPYKSDHISTKIHKRKIDKIRSSASLGSMASEMSRELTVTSTRVDSQSIRLSEWPSTQLTSLSLNSNVPYNNEHELKDDNMDFVFHVVVNAENHELDLISEGAIDSVQGSQTVPPLSPLNILLVDDSVAIRKLASAMLSKEGHTVTEARNGEESLRKQAEVRNDQTKAMKPFDVVIIDLHMPVMDGIESTTRLRKIEKDLSSAMISYNRQLVILCSANNDNTTTDLAYKAGCDYVLEKPLSVAEFHKQYIRLTNSDDYFMG